MNSKLYVLVLSKILKKCLEVLDKYNENPEKPEFMIKEISQYLGESKARLKAKLMLNNEISE